MENKTACKFKHHVSLSALEPHDDAITALSFHPKADHLASAHESGIADVCHSDELIASASEDGYVRVWVPKLKKHSLFFGFHESAVRSVHFSPCGEKLVTASDDKSINLWSPNNMTILGRFNEHSHGVRCAKFSPNGKLLISCSDDKTTKLWDITSGKCVQTFSSQKIVMRTGSSSEVCPRYVEFHPNGTTVASGHEDGCVFLFDLRANSLLQYYIVHTGDVNMIKFHPNRNILLTAADDSTMKILDLLEGREISTLHGHNGAVTCIAFSNDGMLLASGSTDQRVLLWRFNNLYMDPQFNSTLQLMSSLLPIERDIVDANSNSDEQQKENI
ncbi:PREDICTED: POC1 centriolar protein homolog A-like isoform X2 [Wasmannia auropunctata]|uniref:POC1 centriolar protein homolog A-like isoform X2 n=1 Tax=Wasmannia auropunctata TaxID=64793 RepID=UPI0005EFC51C|nr:PREDICTED: POC1 centriolar protein homolog A-like isoform X2 [Wasmannia auropunctata]